MDNSVVGSG